MNLIGVEQRQEMNKNNSGMDNQLKENLLISKMALDFVGCQSGLLVDVY